VIHADQSCYDSSVQAAMSAKQTSIDPAALAVASVAAIVSVTVAEGEYNLLSVPIGITVLFVLYAHDQKPSRTQAESATVAAVSAFGIMLLWSYPLEHMFKRCDTTSRYRCFLRCDAEVAGLPLCFPVGVRDSFDSTVPPDVLAGVWALALGGLFGLDRWRVRRVAASHVSSHDSAQTNDLVRSAASRSSDTGVLGPENVRASSRRPSSVFKFLARAIVLRLYARALWRLLRLGRRGVN
jgi:hypothetical protein